MEIEKDVLRAVLLKMMGITTAAARRWDGAKDYSNLEIPKDLR